MRIDDFSYLVGWLVGRLVGWRVGCWLIGDFSDLRFGHSDMPVFDVCRVPDFHFA